MAHVHNSFTSRKATQRRFDRAKFDRARSRRPEHFRRAKRWRADLALARSCKPNCQPLNER
jgi:hypothetical protein